MHTLVYDIEVLRNMQLTLDFQYKQRTNKSQTKTNTHAEFSIEHCKQAIQTDTYLWDMRCWDNYKDRKEVTAFLSNIDNNNGSLNAGHVHLCIRVALYQHGVSIAQVARWIMENPHIQYRNRIVKCWDDSMKCPKFKKHRHYSNGLCEDCY